MGVRDTEAAIVLSSWQEALDSCGSPEWEDLCLEAANQYRNRLQERLPREYARWNDVVNEVKPLSQALVREKTQPIIDKEDLPDVFRDTVDWDILHLCMEAAFADVYEPGFYTSQAYWYAQGHFPLRMEGSVPGRQAVRLLGSASRRRMPDVSPSWRPARRRRS